MKKPRILQECEEDKMKIAVCSDLHLEFGNLELKNPGDVDVLILSGDICVAKDLMYHDNNGIVSFGKSERYHTFFQNVAEQFSHVIYVAGNHEHYHGDFKHTIPSLKEFLGYIPNIHILDKEVFELNDVVFVGGTLWTDMNKEDPLTLHGISRMMNDFRCVDNSNRVVNFKTFEPKEKPEGMSGEEFNMLPYEQRYKNVFKTRPARFCPEDAVEDHKKMLDYARIVYEGMPPWKQMVFVGHHTPSHFSCHPQYKDDTLMNGGYHSDLTEFILDRPGIKLWTHGHTHEEFDYEIGDCRVVCNPRGYIGYETIADDFKLKVVEL
jgi:predicted phosphodiesterase